MCKQCHAKPKSELRAIEHKDEIFGFMRQSHISEKERRSSGKLTKPENLQVAGLATIVLKVARVKPYKKRRLGFLARMHPELMRSLEETGLVYAHILDWEPTELTEVPGQANSEETEIFPLEDLEATNSYAVGVCRE